MSRACVLLADGFEEIEAVTTIDVLRRADIEVAILGVTSLDVRGSHDVTVRADALLTDRQQDSWDLVVLPGGMPGAANLRDSDAVQQLLVRQNKAGGKLAAICAAPIALSRAGLLENRAATSYPSFRGQVDCGDYREQEVVVDGNVITSRGPATALAFALTLVEQLGEPGKAAALRQAMLVAA